MRGKSARRADGVAASSGNVFADVGVKDAAVELVRAELLRKLRAIVKRRKLSGAEAQAVLGVKPPQAAALIGGQPGKVTIDRLVRWLHRLEQRVEFVVSPMPPKSVTIGRKAFEKIMAVEGLKLTPEMKRRRADFDRRGLSPEERIREIIKIYRKG